MSSGWTPAYAKPTRRSFGFSPSSSTAVSDASSAAVAPSVSPAELPAVTRPPARKGVRRFARPSSVVSGRRNSSRSATRRVLEQAGITLDDVGLFELNEPFAVQVLTWCRELGVDPDDERLNPYGGAIACGHPLAATGVRLIAQLAYGMRERDVEYGLTALCVGMGMGAALLWQRAG